jgi:hypothetical protein
MEIAVAAVTATVRSGRPGAGTSFGMRRVRAGTVRLPTGRMCVADAYSADAFPPLSRLVPPGDYPVEIVVASLPLDLRFGNDRCAFMMAVFDEAHELHWEPVTAVAAAMPSFTDEDPNSFIQEGATGLFSPEAGAAHLAHLRRSYDEQMLSIRRHANHIGSSEWVNFSLGQDGANIIICEGGFGDGACDCFVGLTAAGRVARLVVDFCIADPATE